MKDSCWEANSESSDEEGVHKISMVKLKMIINEQYEPSTIHKYSSALDILASFIKSQAFLYNESSNHCRHHLNLFMLPCIFLSTMCSVFASISDRFDDGLLYISIMNGVISFLLAIVNYLKLDAAAEAHHIASNHFSRLKTMLEFSSGETLLFENPLLQSDGIEREMNTWLLVHCKDTDDYDEKRRRMMESLYRQRKELKDELIHNLQAKISTLKEKVIEIKENNRFAIPKMIMNSYPIIFNINIFSFIKTVDDYRNGLINTLKNVLNEIKFIGNKSSQSEEEKERIKNLYEHKNEIMNELVVLTSTCNLVDVMFHQEIQNAILYKKHYGMFLLQKCANIFTRKGAIFLPKDYKNPYDCGYYDNKTGKSLLRKILNL
jgi:hypothetical protein